jgi:hypothetical protein
MELHKVHLTDTQKRKLLKGQSIQLKHEHLINGGSVIIIHKQLGTKIRSAIRRGAGVRLHFSSKDVAEHNIHQGSGFKQLLTKAQKGLYGVSDDVKNVAKKVEKEVGGGLGKTEKFFKKVGRKLAPVGKALAPVAKALKPVGKQILKGVVSQAIPAALNAISAETGVPVGIAAPVLTGVANKAIDGLGLELKKAKKAPAKKKKATKRKAGGALFPSGGALYPAGYQIQ